MKAKTPALALLASMALYQCDPAEPIDPGTTPRTETVELKNTMEVTDADGYVYLVGTDQVSANNQDAYVEKRSPDGRLLWSVHHSTTEVDERAVLITIDPIGVPWVVFSVDGGSNSEDFISRKWTIGEESFANALFRGYGRANGAAKIAVVACLDPSNGRIEWGTFLMSRTAEGNIDAVEKTNSLEITAIEVAQTVEITTHSWYLPPALTASHDNYVFHPDATENTKTGDYWVVDYELARPLNEFISGGVVY